MPTNMRWLYSRRPCRRARPTARLDYWTSGLVRQVLAGVYRCRCGRGRDYRHRWHCRRRCHTITFWCWISHCVSSLVDKIIHENCIYFEPVTEVIRHCSLMPKIVCLNKSFWITFCGKELDIEYRTTKS